MMNRNRIPMAVLAAAMVLAASCGDDGSSAPKTTGTPIATVAPTTASSTTITAPTTMAVPPSVPTDGVTVVSDVVYGEQQAGAWEPLLDVYAPAGASDLPLVVFFHGGGVDKNSLEYPSLAEAIAARGAVVVVPNWGPQGGEPAATIEETVANNDAFLGGAACAISFAVAHADEWGAASDSVTLAGHSGGANAASVLAFDHGRPISGCAVPAETWTPNAVLLWDGELGLLDPSMWDSFGPDLTQIFAIFTPWMMLDGGFTGPVQFVLADWSRQHLQRCDDVTEWAPLRDPSGEYESWLESVGASDDGCVDIGDVSLALGAAMTAASVENSFVPLSDFDTDHTRWSDDDLQRVAQMIYDLAIE